MSATYTGGPRPYTDENTEIYDQKIVAFIEQLLLLDVDSNTFTQGRYEAKPKIEQVKGFPLLPKNWREIDSIRLALQPLTAYQKQKLEDKYNLKDSESKFDELIEKSPQKQTLLKMKADLETEMKVADTEVKKDAVKEKKNILTDLESKFNKELIDLKKKFVDEHVEKLLKLLRETVNERQAYVLNTIQAIRKSELEREEKYKHMSDLEIMVEYSRENGIPVYYCKNCGTMLETLFLRSIKEKLRLGNAKEVKLGTATAITKTENFDDMISITGTKLRTLENWEVYCRKCNEYHDRLEYENYYKLLELEKTINLVVEKLVKLANNGKKIKIEVEK